MLAFSGCYFGGGEKERNELGAIRKRWKTLHVSLHLFTNVFNIMLSESNPVLNNFSVL